MGRFIANMYSKEKKNPPNKFVFLHLLLQLRIYAAFHTIIYVFKTISFSIFKTKPETEGGKDWDKEGDFKMLMCIKIALFPIINQNLHAETNDSLASPLHW